MGGGMQPLWRVYRRYALKYWHWYLTGFACLYATNWLSVKIPLELGRGIDVLAQGGDSADVVRAAITIGCMGLGVMLIRTFSRILVFTPGRYVEHDLRRAVFGHVLTLQKRDRIAHSAGDMVSRTANDITVARALVGFGTMQVVNVAVALGLTGHEMWKLSPELTLYAALPVAVGVFAMQGGIRAIYTLTRRLQELLADLSEQVLASFQGVGVVKGFVAQAAFEARFRERSQGLLEAGVRLALIGGFFQPLMGVAASVALFFLLAFGGPLAVSGEVSVGQIAAFAAYLLYIVPPL
jgi:ATP-binding cassette subfamily B protein